MMRASLIVLVAVALTAAAGSAFLAQRVGERREAAALQTAPTGAPLSQVEVLIVGTDLKPGSAVSRSALQWQPWPESAVRGEYLSVRLDLGSPAAVEQARAARLREVEGMNARRQIAAGEPLFPAKLYKTGASGFMAGALGPGMRAVSVAVRAETAAAGFILPGDRVDVILAHDITTSLQRGDGQGVPQVGIVKHAAEVVVEDARVLAIDQTANADAKDKEAALVGKVVTLEVTPEEAQGLAVARQMGDLQVVLRDIASTGTRTPEAGRGFVGDMAVSPSLASAVEVAIQAKADHRAAAVASLLEEPEPTPPPAAGPAAPAWTVTVVRGSRIERVSAR